MSATRCRPAASPAVLVDAHIHLHEGFAAGAFFDAAANVAAGAGQLGLPQDTAGVLVLAEGHGVDAFLHPPTRPPIPGG